MLEILLLYLFSLAFGLNFVLSGIVFQIEGLYFWLIAFFVLFPALLLALYLLRGSVEILYGREKLLRNLFYLFALISVALVTLLIVPLTYS